MSSKLPNDRERRREEAKKKEEGGKEIREVTHERPECHSSPIVVCVGV